MKNIVLLIKNLIGNIQEKKITILGLSFKPNTDDIRDSTSIKLIQLLLKENPKITAHDPKAIENTRLIFANKIKYTNSIEEALRNSECAIIMTAWNQYAQLNGKDVALMKKRVIVDSRRLLINHKLDIDYHAIGVGKSLDIKN